MRSKELVCCCTEKQNWTQTCGLRLCAHWEPQIFIVVHPLTIHCNHDDRGLVCWCMGVEVGGRVEVRSMWSDVKTEVHLQGPWLVPERKWPLFFPYHSRPCAEQSVISWGRMSASGFRKRKWTSPESVCLSAQLHSSECNSYTSRWSEVRTTHMNPSPAGSAFIHLTARFT